ncbi:MAG: hypothetical protein KF850_20105 [Labilithrix sp.]|nr:hypothetical protein [Labilithrix sp.]
MKPEFVDNLDGNTLAAALRAYLDELHAKLKEPTTLRIASGYFNPEGFATIADRLARLKEVRLLLGAEPVPPPALPVRLPGAPRGARWAREVVANALSEHSRGLTSDRDRVPFEPQHDGAIRKLVEVLRSGTIKVKRYEKAFLHGKAYVFGDQEGALVGSSNFTYAGLHKNLELNLGSYQPSVVTRVTEWFDRLWEEAAEFDLAALYEARFQPYPPYLIYLRTLWELFRGDLRPEAVRDNLNLTSFQRDGVWRVRRLLEERGGVLVADEVGLGKSFMAGDIIEEYLRKRRTRVLVIAPAALRDGPWSAFLKRFQLRDAEVRSFEEVQRDHRLGAGGSDTTLDHDPNDYALVVVDEAQAVRNPDALRSRALRALLRGAPRKKLLLMSATPVNNSVWDLYTLLTYFVENDGIFADHGIPSLSKHFHRIAAADPEDLQPDALFDVLDATTVRRTRHFIKRYYPNERIKDSKGNEISIKFPRPCVLPVTYDLDAAMPGLFERIRDALDPADGEHRLTLARYAPDEYRKRGAGVDAQTAALIGLLRSGILKRFESSAHAFAATLRKLALGCSAFLKGLDEGKVLHGRGLSEVEDLSDLDEWNALLEDGEWRPAAEYHVSKLRKAVEGDRDLFTELLREVERLEPLDNPKLLALEVALSEIAKQARREGGADDRDRRKVIVFTFFEDTARWLYDALVDFTSKRKSLADYRGRIVAVSGDWSEGASRDEAVFGFAPKSTEAPPGRDADRFDLLITTDVLAEGMNLQQCRHIINFDLPWNPMRLVQRHGRVDRIGSPHDTIYLRCFLPDRQLDALLELEARLRHKLAQAAATIGLGAEVLPGSAVADKTFGETREQIDRLRHGDPDLFERSGEKPNAHSGEEFRHELLKAFERAGTKEAVLSLPGSAGTALIQGGASGHFFCARIGERVFLRFVHDDASRPIERDTLGALRRIVCRRDTPYAPTGPAFDRAYEAWRRARNSIHEDWTWATDPKNIQPKIPAALREAARHLEQHAPPEVSADKLRHTIEALEAPRRGRVERAIREILDRRTSDGQVSVSVALVEKVIELGLEPYAAPKALPEITEDEILLICWATVVSDGSGPPSQAGRAPVPP